MFFNTISISSTPLFAGDISSVHFFFHSISGAKIPICIVFFPNIEKIIIGYVGHRLDGAAFGCGPRLGGGGGFLDVMGDKQE